MSLFQEHSFRLWSHWRGWVLIIVLLIQTGICQGTNMGKGDLAVHPPADKLRNVSTMKVGKWRIEYDLANGVADIYCDGKLLLARAYAVARLPETVTSRDYQTRTISRQKIQDGFGRGSEFTVKSANGDADKMVQTFWLYEKLDYILAEVKILRRSGAASNYLSPLTSQTPVCFLPDGDNRALVVPFDNDKWARYNAAPFGSEVTSHEVSALYNNASRQGLVIGSMEHDTWKTGVKSTTTSNAITSLEIFGGVTSSETRDVLPHGKISGQMIKSPKIFIGCFADWRTGMETFAQANAIVAPPRAWHRGVPFGWNSWGKLQFRLSFAKAMEVSDFFATELQPQHFQNDGTVYIGLDSGWNKFTDAELKLFVEHCHSNHQAAGIYFTPFVAWGDHPESPIAGTDYHFKDLYLYANGQQQTLDGGIALDPTHPGTKKLIQHALNRFQQAGFQYIKADFLGHGALEGDKFFDPKVTTGIQAYNAGMKFVADTIGPDIYLNESIAPLFPAHYANSRRIACDTFGGISESEYALNSLTYGWWLAGVYDFNDADHIVLGGHSDGENRARVTASAITGIFISGDDFSRDADPAGKERAKKYLTNADINAVAKIKKSFRPIEGNTGNRASTLFSCADRSYFYLAAFNFSKTNTVLKVDLNRAGVGGRGPVWVRELWSGVTNRVAGSLTIQLPAADAALYQFYKNGQPGAR